LSEILGNASGDINGCTRRLLDSPASIAKNLDSRIRGKIVDCDPKINGTGLPVDTGDQIREPLL